MLWLLIVPPPPQKKNGDNLKRIRSSEIQRTITLAFFVNRRRLLFVASAYKMRGVKCLLRYNPLVATFVGVFSYFFILFYSRNAPSLLKQHLQTFVHTYLFLVFYFLSLPNAFPTLIVIQAASRLLTSVCHSFVSGLIHLFPALTTLPSWLSPTSHLTPARLPLQSSCLRAYLRSSHSLTRTPSPPVATTPR